MVQEPGQRQAARIQRGQAGAGEDIDPSRSGPSDLCLLLGLTSWQQVRGKPPGVSPRTPAWRAGCLWDITLPDVKRSCDSACSVFLFSEALHQLCFLDQVNFRNVRPFQTCTWKRKEMGSCVHAGVVDTSLHSSPVVNSLVILKISVGSIAVMFHNNTNHHWCVHISLKIAEGLPFTC